MSSQPHPQTGQPVGLPVDTTPAERPGPVTLAGRYGRVEKLGPQHAAALWEGLKDHPRVWTYMPSYGPFIESAAFAGIFRNHMIGRGRSRDTAWYAMIDSEWPARKAAFERWLAPENFDADGKQRDSLSAMNGATL